MSLLAESLVEEWLNRAGYFTIRGVRYGVHEIDLLAVRRAANGIEARHVEVQISTNPVSYITPLTHQRAKDLGKARSSAWPRPPEILQESVVAWVEKKYFSPDKQRARERAWPELSWSLEFVHGKAKYPAELEAIRAAGINTVPFLAILKSLCHDPAVAHKGGAGSDIADILAYYVKNDEVSA
jgi:hypothetical protein